MNYSDYPVSKAIDAKRKNRNSVRKTGNPNAPTELKFVNKKKPYDERSDLEKILSQWKKLSGLVKRKEWSAAVVRAATAAEIATNFAIRKEFSEKSNFDEN